MKEFIWGRYALWAYTGLAAVIFAGLSTFLHPYFLGGVAIFIVTFGLGCHDFFQKKRGLLANTLIRAHAICWNPSVLSYANIFGKRI